MRSVKEQKGQKGTRESITNSDGKVNNFPELQRKLTKREYNTVIDYAISKGFTNAFYQENDCADTSYIPKWDY